MTVLPLICTRVVSVAETEATVSPVPATFTRIVPVPRATASLKVRERQGASATPTAFCDGIWLTSVGATVSSVRMKGAEAGESVPSASRTIAVSVWLDPDRVPVVKDHAPLPSAVVVPSRLAPAYSVTSPEASVVPVRVGARTLVRLSPGIPLSDMGASAIVGAVGAAMMVRISPPLAVELLPAWSTVTAVRVCRPAARLATPPDHTPFSSASVSPTSVAPS